MWIYFTLLLAIIGAGMFFICAHAKRSQFGLMLFAVAALAFLLTYAGPTISLLGHR